VGQEVTCGATGFAEIDELRGTSPSSGGRPRRPPADPVRDAAVATPDKDVRRARDRACCGAASESRDRRANAARGNRPRGPDAQGGHDEADDPDDRRYQNIVKSTVAGHVARSRSRECLGTYAAPGERNPDAGSGRSGRVFWNLPPTRSSTRTSRSRSSNRWHFALAS
jgi:hypothetical protein